MQSFPWVKFTAMTTGFMGIGWALMKVVTPSEEDLYNRMAPDLQKNVDSIRAARIAKENAMAQVKAKMQADPAEQKPIWAEPPKKM